MLKIQVRGREPKVEAVAPLVVLERPVHSAVVHLELADRGGPDQTRAKARSRLRLELVRAAPASLLAVPAEPHAVADVSVHVRVDARLLQRRGEGHLEIQLEGGVKRKVSTKKERKGEAIATSHTHTHLYFRPAPVHVHQTIGNVQKLGENQAQTLGLPDRRSPRPYGSQTIGLPDLRTSRP